MESVINQIHALSTKNDGDLKKLRDFLRHEHDGLKANAQQIDQALQMLDPALNSLGVAFLLAVQLGAAAHADQRATFAYVCNFLKVADEQQVKKAIVPVNSVCKSFAQMAIDDGPRYMLQSLLPLRAALQKLQPNPETLTPVHAELMRVCLKAKAYHFAEQVLDQRIFDIALSSPNCTQMTAMNFLSFFYYGAMIRIGMKDYVQALQLLLVVLTCPATCLSAIQADAFKKYALVSLKVHGDLQALPVYASHIVQRYAKSPSYVLDIVEAFKQGDAAALNQLVEEEAAQIQADKNTGLVKQVCESLRRHKLQMLTKTYLTLSLGEIAREIGADETNVGEVEDLLFDMISSGEINARIDQRTANVSFEDGSEDMDVGMVDKMQDKLQRILKLTTRIAQFEQEVVSSEAYIRKTALLEGERAGLGQGMTGYDFMDM